MTNMEKFGGFLIVLGIFLIIDGILSILSPAVGHFPIADIGRTARTIIGISLVGAGEWIRRRCR